MKNTSNLLKKTAVSFTLACTLAAGVAVPFGGNGQFDFGVNKVEAATKYQSANVVVNGKKIKLDQSAIVKNGSTLIPVRGVFEELGAEVTYSSNIQQVKIVKGSTKIILIPGTDIAFINGIQYTLSARSEVINGRTLVPLRFVAESLGAKVAWDQKSNTASVTLDVKNEQVNKNLIQSDYYTGGFHVNLYLSEDISYTKGAPGFKVKLADKEGNVISEATVTKEDYDQDYGIYRLVLPVEKFKSGDTYRLIFDESDDSINNFIVYREYASYEDWYWIETTIEPNGGDYIEFDVMGYPDYVIDEYGYQTEEISRIYLEGSDEYPYYVVVEVEI